MSCVAVAGWGAEGPFASTAGLDFARGSNSPQQVHIRHLLRTPELTPVRRLNLSGSALDWPTSRDLSGKVHYYPRSRYVAYGMAEQLRQDVGHIGL
jgi:hypothetical protein